MSRVIVISHPLTETGRHAFELNEAGGLDSYFAEAIARTDIEAIHIRNAYVEINGEQVCKDEWLSCQVSANDDVLIIGNHGGDFGGILLQVAGLALSAFVPPIGGLTFAGVNIGPFLVRAGISILTSLAAQALAPNPKRPNLGPNDPVEARFSITGTRNTVQPYGLVPRVYGKVENYFPPLAAQPYVQVHGADNQRIVMLFAISEGWARVTNYLIGDQPATQLPGVEIEAKQDVTFATMPTLYPGRVTSESLSIQLKQSTAWHSRRSPENTNEIFLEVSFPQGLGRLTDRNIKFGIEVTFEVQIRLLGSSTWQTPAMADAGGAVVNGGFFTVLGFYKSAVRRAVKLTVSNGQWDVRIRRVTVDDQSIGTGENQSTTFENSYWSAVRFHDNRRPIEREGVTLVAIVAQATDSLNGVIDQLSVTAESLIPVWNGSSWVTQYTRNPAWVFCDVLRSDGNSTPIEDARIDLAQMLEWANQCDEWNITFDGVLNYDTSVWSFLNEVAAVGRASPVIKDGIYSVFIDRPQTTPAQLITPRNSANASGSRILSTPVHALKVNFPNRLTRGVIDEITVYNDGYDETNATNIEALDLPWTTDASAAWREARVFMAKAALRNEIFSREMDFEHIRFHRGDLVELQDPVMKVGLHAARVKSLALPDVTLDAPLSFTMEASKTYAMRIRHNDGTIYETELVNDIAATNTVETVSIDPENIAVDDLITIGESGAITFDVLVRSITPKADKSAEVTFLPAAANLYDAISGPVPEYDPGITLPPPLIKDRPPKPIITSVESDERVLVGTGFAAQSAIAVGVIVEVAPEKSTPEVLQFRYRISEFMTNWTYVNLPTQSTEAILSPVEDLREYEIEARTTNEFGLASDWARVTHTVIGKSTLPPNVERFYRQGSSLTWPYPNPPADFVGFRLRANYGSSLSLTTAFNVTDGLISAPPFDISDFNGTMTFLLTAVDSIGNESAVPATLTINIGDAVVSNLLLKQDEDATGYTGSKVDCTVNGSDLEADVDSAAAFWGSASSAFWGDGSDPFWSGTTYKAMTYTATYAPVTNHIGAVIRMDLATIGDTSVEYREFMSVAFWGAGGAAFWGSADAPFWDDEIAGDWTPFPGLLGPIVATSSSFQFRVSIAATTIDAGRGEITNMDVLVDVPDIVEHFEDEPIAASGTVRLPITKTYRVISIVNLTVQDDGGTGFLAKIFDKDATNGPEIQVFNSSGTRVAGTIDATVIGY